MERGGLRAGPGNGSKIHATCGQCSDRAEPAPAREVTSSTIPDELDEITDEIIGAAVRVHDDLGPGLLEGIYQEALLLELDRQGLSVSAEVEAPVTYRGQDLSRRCRIDLLVEDQVVLEIKAIENIRPVHRAKLLTYLRITEKRVGLLLNFHRSRLVDGIHRIVR